MSFTITDAFIFVLSSLKSLVVFCLLIYDTNSFALSWFCFNTTLRDILYLKAFCRILAAGVLISNCCGCCAYKEIGSSFYRYQQKFIGY